MMSTQTPAPQSAPYASAITSSQHNLNGFSQAAGTDILDRDDWSSASEDSSDGGDTESKILSGYRHLASRHVDLVGDYAGDELFLLEGDSLLLRCFDDDKLDFSTGLQLLHAVYNVENFLHQLVRRKCNFKIVFFNSNRHNCLPPASDPADANKYLFARAVIVRHLKVNLVKAHPRISLDVFESWQSREFSDYLHKVSPYFLMVHDGAATTDRKATSENISSSEPAVQRLPLRSMILSFIGRGFNVALINGLQWRDTKVMTMVLESRSRHSKASTPLAKDLVLTLPTIDVSKSLEKLSQSDSSLTERQRLLVLTVAEVSRQQHSEIPSESLPGLCAALLLHQAVLAHTPLAQRRVPSIESGSHPKAFLQVAATTAEAILNGLSLKDQEAKSDVLDLLDGRIFLQVAQTMPAVTPGVKSTFEKLLTAFAELVDTKIVDSAKEVPGTQEVRQSGADAQAENQKVATAVLPFSNKVFDKHLESVRINIDAAAESQRSLASRKIFQEVSHWHNAKRPLAQKGPQPVDAKQAFWTARRNQWFMAEMRTYAASLTNAVGKSLEPETIINGVSRQSTIKPGTQSPADSDMSDSGASSTAGKGKPGQKKGGGGGKTAAKNAGKQAMLNQIAAAKAKKDESANDKIASSWQVVCKGFEADADVRSRYRKAKDYLTNLQPTWREAVGPEIELYLVSCLLQYWIEACKNKEKQRRIQVAALTWSHLRSIGQRGPLPKTIAKYVQMTAETLGLPPITFSEAGSDRRLSFTFALPTKVADLSVKLRSKEFQLLECGPYLERSFDSKPDPRVEFQPDGWQRRVLDTIDAEQSAFVVAPTSAGKTFISFYAMRKVLEADDDGVLVYVAPTKALVNQIAAEIQARYSKKFKYGGKSVWAIHTRDYRINSPNGCQVLVTVPHVLQIMLLAPSNANSWSSRVKRIIFDEIHSIGQAEDGVVWEQLLLMAPCPIIALSATVGNPTEFSEWLATTQSAIGKELQTVQHPYRYSDLRKYYYVPPNHFDFQGIPDKAAFGSLGLEGLKGFNYVHPVAGLVDRSRGFPEDFALEPRDCLYLWQALIKVQDEKHPVPKSLKPDKALPDVSRKVDILKWEKALKDILKAWLGDPTSPYDKLLRELESSFRDDHREDVYKTTSVAATSPHVSNVDASSMVKTTLPMLCRLQEQDALPAILFNYDRHQCEKICQVLLDQLKEAELKQRKSGPKWERTLERFEEWKELKEKNASRNSKAAAKKSKKGKDDEDDEKESKLDMQRDAAGGEDTKWESFDPEAPAEGYHFADHTRAQVSELEVYVRQLKRREVQPWLIQALGRGIGVHHAGMNRKYRQVVEMLFRKGFLRVVVATGTLALGINMPCKTVVFSGDSVFLTALNYRQCAGRAGRRGFDLLGNVVFQGVSRQKVCRLLSSRLPDLNGHFPITTTLVLRLFTLLHESNNAKYAVNAINALLSQPRLYMGGPSFKDQTMHHLRFSIEYLRRQQLLGSDGAPLNFAGLVSHLYFTENSSFAFHALLKEGFFHEICKDINNNEKDTLETLMLVMSHLFNRILCKQADVEYREKIVKPSSSIVFLPPLPKLASQILKDHNKDTLQVFRAYVKTFVDQHIHTEDRILPLTGIEAGGEEDGHSLDALPPTSIRSSFVALSGAGDEFDNVHDLCHTTRQGVFLEEAVIPHMEVYPEETEVPINAYLLDFFKHGDIMTIEKANRVRRADIWFLLNDFSLVLATIITSLANFMKLTDGNDLDMLDLMGRMDAHEEEEDDKMAAVEQESVVSGPSIADSGVVIADRTKPAAPTKRQAKNADSWEDLAGDDDDEVDSTTARELAIEAEAIEQELNSWDGAGGDGLKNVLKAFQKLHAEFNIKFKAMWA